MAPDAQSPSAHSRMNVQHRLILDSSNGPARCTITSFLFWRPRCCSTPSRDKTYHPGAIQRRKSDQYHWPGLLTKPKQRRSSNQLHACFILAVARQSVVVMNLPILTSNTYLRGGHPQHISVAQQDQASRAGRIIGHPTSPYGVSCATLQCSCDYCTDLEQRRHPCPHVGVFEIRAQRPSPFRPTTTSWKGGVVGIIPGAVNQLTFTELTADRTVLFSRPKCRPSIQACPASARPKLESLRRRSMLVVVE
ncbi:hypothetical protein BDP55DRAFT_326398 [Colletotrichum godetiae]|uniref:SWIM-type domain-containing protein n=1 Tax=Colletotrichum godetiae TaxID=1209918 RepID=A0AAJ0ABA5_9PEZI|nr:uncharacterized protein BDP55DRAFT_326398 [Colletotrichum godetiae]KAK1659967.1 hypothetical protein BDP55DRAFT_326398 [Colletotrichum godetiae]